MTRTEKNESGTTNARETMDNARTLYAEYVSYAERNLNGCTPMTFDDFCKAHVTPYEVRQTSSGWAVVRIDGTYAEFMDPSEADEALEFLQSGDMTETDYEWTAELDTNSKCHRIHW